MTSSTAPLAVEIVDRTARAHGTVHELRIAVADPHSGNVWRCAAELTVPSDPRSVLLICVHGATYNRWYWNPDGQPDQHSFVHAAAARGFATINIDRIGYGRSDHPDGGALSLDLHAATVTTIAALARSDLAGMSFDRVVGVGHSVGTYVVMTALNGKHALDSAVLTGISHARTDADPVSINVEARTDVRYAGRNTEGYSALPAQHREQFYYLPTAAPDMIAADAQHADVIGHGELTGIPTLLTAPCAAAVPLCLGLAVEDWMFVCADNDEFRREEGAWYPAAKSIDFLIYPETGHNINLHRDGPPAMSDWLDWIEGQE